jgi:pimeloyl-ACP methyl ester carboxylesterase
MYQRPGDAVMRHFKLGLSLLFISLFAAISRGQRLVVPRLEEPSGKYAVGREAFHWIDEHRVDSLSDDHRAHRELMVYLWYPAVLEPDGRKWAVLLPGADRIDKSSGATQMRDAVFGGAWPFVVSNSINSHAVENAPVAKNAKTFPLVLFSHGGRWSSFGYTSLIEGLVSHGYVVAAIEYPYEAAAVAFPDKVIAYSPKNFDGMNSPAGTPYEEMVRKAMAWIRERANVMAEDQRFVLDKLSSLNSGSDKHSLLAGRLDLNRVAALGHSMGGQASVRACQLDDRIKACANLDGATVDGIFLKYDATHLIKQPFLYVEVPFVPLSEDRLTEMHITRDEWRKQWATTVDEQFRSSTREGYSVVLRGPAQQHLSFADVSVLSAPLDSEARRVAVHNLNLGQAVTLAFLDKYLQDAKASILDAAPQSHLELEIKRYKQ